MANPREIALKILCDVETEGAYLNISFQSRTEKADLDRRDAAFLKELCYGTVKQKLILDSVIRRFSSIRLKKIAPIVLQLLRMGVYQLYFMDKVPQSAAVNETVKLCGRYGAKSRGFVNAILRKAAETPLTLPEDESPESLSLRHSHPLPLTEWYIQSFGEEKAKELLAENNRNPALCLRYNEMKTDDEALMAALSASGIKAHFGTLCDTALVVDSGAPQKLSAYAEGFFTVQDQSAQLAALALDPKQGDRVFDLCAAPGGKTTHLAELMENRGEILALDIYEKRLLSVTKTAERLGISIIKTLEADAASYAFPHQADKILMDVPCSGLGVIRRRPDIKYKTDLTAFDALLDIQRRILENGAKHLVPGGTMVYSTCTVNPAENQEQIQGFLKDHPEFSLCPAENPHITGALDLRQKGMISIFPTKDGGDGFFVAKLKKH